MCIRDRPRSPRPKRASKSSRPNSPNWVDVEAPLPTITNRAEAGAFLDERIGQGVKPGLERITGLLDMMGNPETDYPVIHVAGTNGKTTVTRLIADILGAHGIRTGSFTSPHLHRIEAVSYTHLRAHETVLDLVCRLLLEKKK